MEENNTLPPYSNVPTPHIPPVNSMPNQTPKKRIRIFSIFIQVFVVAIILISIREKVLEFLTFAMDYSQHKVASKSVTSLPSQTTSQSSATKLGKYYLKSGTVVRTSDEKIIFTNVPSSITNVIDGPDGNTIHFKIDASNAQEIIGLGKCADLSKVRNSQNRYIAATALDNIKTLAAWDYQKIGTIQNPEFCSGGFLQNSPYFAYLMHDGTQNNILSLHDTLTNKIIIIALPKEVEKGFSSQAFSRPQKGMDGKDYYYTDRDIFVNNTLVIGYQFSIIGVNVTSYQNIGIYTLNSEDMVGDTYLLENKQGLPLVLITSGWEGYIKQIGVIDISDSKFNFTDLKILNGASAPLLAKGNLQLSEWQTDKVIFNSYTFTDITEKLGDIEKIEGKNGSLLDDAGQTRVNKSMEDKLMAMRTYSKVVCDLFNGFSGGSCKSVTTKKYSLHPKGTITPL